MKEKTIYIYHHDAQYLRAAAEKLALLVKGARLVLADTALDLRGKDVYIMEKFMPMSMAAEEISSRYGLVSKAGSCTLTGFTSGLGGVGTTSAALALARIWSEAGGHKVLYLSLDPIALKCAPKRGSGKQLIYKLLFGREKEADELSGFVKDSFGVSYLASEGILNPLSFLDCSELSALISKFEERFERIVLDVPSGALSGPDILELCETVVVCYGWHEDNTEASEELFTFLSEERDRVFRFSALYDEEDCSDIYGQFGAEVRHLAQQIEAN